MGMFDEICCHLPLPDPRDQDRVFQTKDLDCSLDCYRITEEGVLEIANYGGCQESEIGHIWEPVDITGEIQFHDLDDEAPAGESGWLCYVAQFERGKVTKVEGPFDHDNKPLKWREQCSIG
jgi:hypothetical protein